MRQLKWLSLLGLLLLGPSAYAQSVRVQSQAISSRGAGIANATVAVCTQPAVTTTQPCSPLATLATSTSTTSGGANPLTADSFGNFFFYAAPGRYTVQIFGPAVFGQFVIPDVEVASTAGGSSAAFSSLTVSGALVSTAPSQIGGTYYPANVSGADCGVKINNFESLVTGPATFIADSTCPAGTWTAATVSRNNHTILCPGPVQFTINNLTLSGNFDKVDGCYFIQVGGVDQFTVNVAGNDNRVSNLTIDGSASQPGGNASDDSVEIRGSRNWIENVRVIATQGGCISVYGTITGGGDHNTITKNKCYNATKGVNSGIVVANIPASAGSFANFNDVLDNYVDTTATDCIFESANAGSSPLSGGTMAKFNKVNGNTVTGCGDSGIEIGEGSYESTVSYNTIDAKVNGALICRDCINPHFIGNSITMESTTAADGIDISSQNLPATFDQHAQVEGNIVRGWITAGRACFYANGSGANFKANDCEFTAGVANIHSITGTSGTVTLITNQPLLLPNGKSIIVAGTTNYNGTFTLLSVNDLTNTYTFALGGTIAQETAGTISFITSTGSNLQGIGINCGGFQGLCSAQGNRIKNVLTGIGFDGDNAAHSETGLVAMDNWIIRTGIGIDIHNITCTGCAFNNNHLQTYATVGFNDSGASGTNTSYVWGNSFYAAGFGGTPNENNANFPGYLGINPYLDSTFTVPILRMDKGGFMCLEGSNPVVVGAGWDLMGCNSTSHMFQVQYGSNGSVPLGITGNTSGTHSDSGFYQTKRGVTGCTTAASIGGTCATDITVTWSTAFQDANYSVTCTGNTPTAVPAAPFVVSGTKLAATVHINYFAITAVAASYATIDCSATHD